MKEKAQIMKNFAETKGRLNNEEKELGPALAELEDKAHDCISQCPSSSQSRSNIWGHACLGLPLLCVAFC